MLSCLFIFSVGVIKMKKIIYILSVVVFVFSVAFSATPMQSHSSMSMYGYETLLQVEELVISENQFDDDDDEVDRKRRHRRRRKIRPPQKGW